MNDAVIQTAPLSKKEVEFRNSVARDVDAMLKCIPNIQQAFEGFAGHAYTTLKSPKCLLLPSFADKHHKAYKQFLDTCGYYSGHNNFFNMCIRMAEIACMRCGGEHIQATAKRQAMMAAFKRTLDSGMFSDSDIVNYWGTAVHLVAKKEPGYEKYLEVIIEMVESWRSLLVLIKESSKDLVTKMAIPALVDDMVIYYIKVNDQTEEAILA